jgi:hypothetical protein
MNLFLQILLLLSVSFTTHARLGGEERELVEYAHCSEIKKWTAREVSVNRPMSLNEYVMIHAPFLLSRSETTITGTAMVVSSFYTIRSMTSLPLPTSTKEAPGPFSETVVEMLRFNLRHFSAFPVFLITTRES